MHRDKMAVVVASQRDRNRTRASEVDSLGSDHGSCEHGDEPSGLHNLTACVALGVASEGLFHGFNTQFSHYGLAMRFNSLERQTFFFYTLRP
jgi:hypothetical protein